MTFQSGMMLNHWFEQMGNPEPPRKFWRLRRLRKLPRHRRKQCLRRTWQSKRRGMVPAAQDIDGHSMKEAHQLCIQVHQVHKSNTATSKCLNPCARVSAQAAAEKIQAIYRGRMAREQACVCVRRLAHTLSCFIFRISIDLGTLANTRKKQVTVMRV